MIQRILLFSIGSIQNFIINSRKVSDLFNSSRILSDLIANGIEFVNNKTKGELLLPQILNYDKSLPNYFIIKYESNNSLGRETEKYVRDKYMQMLMNSSIGTSLEKHKHQIEKQLDSSLDIYWVEYELEENFDLNDSDKYKEVYKNIYEHFEAVKNIKKFNSICEEGKKCSICGARNALVVRYKRDKKPFGIQSIYTYKNEDKQFEEKSLFKLIDKLKDKDLNLSLDTIKKIKKEGKANYINLDIINNKLKENEMLCSVCLLKRIYNTENKYTPSLAQIALTMWRKTEENSQQYIDVIHRLNKTDNNFDIYECMYKENWDKVLKKLKVENKEQLSESFDKLTDKNLPKYYCMYRMDIDNLGKWMSGKYKYSQENLYKYQKKLSIRINNFFNKVKDYFKDESRGSLIYAGGDDLLALIPVDEILNLEENIYTDFQEEIQKEEYKDITYSKGIFVAHYKTPLREIIRVSKKELENVKEKFKEKVNDFDKEKNATVISIMTEGYSNRSVYFKSILENKKTIEFIFKDLMEYFKKDESTYFHDQLQSEFWDFNKNLEKDYEADIILNMFEIEQKRMMKRSISKNSVPDEIVEDINSKLIEFLKVNSSKEAKVDFENYFNLFHIIRNLKQSMVVK